MDILNYVLQAIPLVFSASVIASMVFGTAVGIAVGALPGLSATMGIAVLIPLTFSMEPLVALGMIAGIYNGAMYGGAIPAILLRIPGTPAGIATVLDGYPMAQKGQAKLALNIAVASSAIGSAASAIALLVLAPPLAALALKFSPANYFWLAAFGLTTIAVLLSDSAYKGLLSVCLGLVIGMIGIDPIMGNERFAFNDMHLLSGIDIIVLLTGLYAIPPAIELALSSKSTTVKKLSITDKKAHFVWKRLLPVWIKASGIGVVTGVIPALGGNIAAIFAWNEQRRGDPDKEKYGKGAPEGVAAAECANNADTAASLIPALTLGIPGSGVAAVILGALLVHGLRPGPQLFQQDAEVTYGFMLTLLCTAGLVWVLGRYGAMVFVNVLRIPQHLLAPMIICMTVIGIYSIHNSFFEVWLMLGFGVLGYAMERLSIPTPPAVLAVILGPMAESALRRSLLISGNDVGYLFSGVISWLLICAILLSIGVPVLRKILGHKPQDSVDITQTADK